MEYSRDQIYNLVSIYEKLHFNLQYSTVRYSNSYGPLTKKLKPTWGSHTRTIEAKLDILKSIHFLSAREKFILLATVYEGQDGCDIFSDWLDITEKDMKDLQNEVLDKMVRLMNPEKEHRGGTRPNAGRKRKSKTKKDNLIRA